MPDQKPESTKVTKTIEISETLEVTETTQAPETSPRPKTGPGSKRDRFIKIGFLVVLIVGVVLIYLYQRNPTTGLDWSKDYDAVLKEGPDQQKPVILLFMASPPGADTKLLVRKIQSKSSIGNALKKHDYLKAVAIVSNNLQKDDIARKFKIKKLPTVIVFSPKGDEVDRREGYFGDGEMVKLLALGANSETKPKGAAD